MMISSPRTPFSVNSNALSAPEIPDPIITYFLEIGTEVSRFVLR
jgi:hypothetical protein